MLSKKESKKKLSFQDPLKGGVENLNWCYQKGRVENQNRIWAISNKDWAISNKEMSNKQNY